MRERKIMARYLVMNESIYNVLRVYMFYSSFPFPFQSFRSIQSPVGCIACACVVFQIWRSSSLSLGDLVKIEGKDQENESTADQACPRSRSIATSSPWWTHGHRPQTQATHRFWAERMGEEWSSTCIHQPRTWMTHEFWVEKTGEEWSTCKQQPQTWVI